MWIWRSVLCVSVVCGLALDSNNIRPNERQDRSNGRNVGRSERRQTEASANSHRGATPACSTPDCHVPVKGSCSNRAQRRLSSQDRQLDRHRERDTDRHRDGDTFNRTKAPEMASCVRSGDCEAGLCCVRYLTGKRCQRIPVEGEACLPRSKQRRNLGRCNCDTGLSCIMESGKNKGQGVCMPRPRQSQRKTRHSGKKRRTAESGC